MNLVEDILDIVSEYMVIGQEPGILGSERMSAIAEKRSVEDLAAANISIAGGTFVLPDLKEMFGSEHDPDCHIVAKVGR